MKCKPHKPLKAYITVWAAVKDMANDAGKWKGKKNDERIYIFYWKVSVFIFLRNSAFSEDKQNKTELQRVKKCNHPFLLI